MRRMYDNDSQRFGWTGDPEKPERLHTVAAFLRVEPDVLYELVNAGRIARYKKPSTRGGDVVAISPAEASRALELDPRPVVPLTNEYGGLGQGLPHSPIQFFPDTGTGGRAAAPQPPSPEGSTLLDQTVDRAFWKVRRGSTNFWVIATFDGVIDQGAPNVWDGRLVEPPMGYAGSYRRARDAKLAWANMPAGQRGRRNGGWKRRYLAALRAWNRGEPFAHDAFKSGGALHAGTLQRAGVTDADVARWREEAGVELPHHADPMVWSDQQLRDAWGLYIDNWAQDGSVPWPPLEALAAGRGRAPRNAPTTGTASWRRSLHHALKRTDSTRMWHLHQQFPWVRDDLPLPR